MKIEAATARDVKNFLLDAGNSLAAFRYYRTREVDTAMVNHVATLIGRDDSGIPVAYGHLDRDAVGFVWLGLCVVEGEAGQGYGREMMRALVAEADVRNLRLRLTVDEGNRVARRLYEQFGFEWAVSLNGKIQMVRSRTMADTLGSLVDKLATCNQKLFVAQEDLYDVRRMTFEEFKAKFEGDDGLRKIWEIFKKACDLNVQRSSLVTEVDQKVTEMIESAVKGRSLDNGSYIQRQHKTY